MRLSTVLALATSAAADWTANQNYGSPSKQHRSLGLSMPKVVKRHEESQSYMDAGKLSFTHGVASGDPYPDSVILWTRASPMEDNDRSNVTVDGYVPLYSHEREQYIQTSKSPVCVSYSVSTSEDFSDEVCSGRAYTSSDIDYTVKVEATGLQSYTQYYYRFSICDSDVQSPVGQTKTTPKPEDDVENVGIAVFSCSNFPYGYFNTYGNSARKGNVDYVVHLGDYIYEYEYTSKERPVQPEREIVTLYDYRRRLATYRTDEDLLLSHQMSPWIATWDDHEIANNPWRGSSSNMNNTEESFDEYGEVSFDLRKMNAVRAYFEWMPIRQVDMDDNLRIWRSFQIGSLFDLVILDTRNYDRSITTLGGWNENYIARIANEASRTLMGSLQENWFYKTLIGSKDRGAAWRVIGSQVIFSHLDLSSLFAPVNDDAWDGYQANKNRTLETLYHNNITNNIFLAGDSHTNWASDLTWLDATAYNATTGAHSLGAEFAGTAVTSSSSYGSDLSIAQANNVSHTLVGDTPSLQWAEGYYRGYFELQISREKVEASFFGAPTVAERNALEVSLANFTVVAGENRLQRPVGGGVVEAGALQRGRTEGSNVTVDTASGEWGVHGFEQMYFEIANDS